MGQQVTQYALLLNATDGSHELAEHEFPQIIGPVDFGLQMCRDEDRTCIGSGVLAGSIIPGSNRLIFTGHSPVWDGFYVSTLGGGGLLWDGIGISFLAIEGRAAEPSVLVLSDAEQHYPKARLIPVDLPTLWKGEQDQYGLYALQHHVFDQLWDGTGTPRVLATGPASAATSFGAIGSSKTSRGTLTHVDCWAGRGGFGSRLVQSHNICAIVYGGDFEDDDLTDRAEADGYFERRFSKSMKLVDLEATTKYRYAPDWHSGGTLGVNFSRLDELMLSFNYRSTAWPRAERSALWQRLVRDHYLAQFNAESIERKQWSNCGEPCPAVCKKMNGEYKKDYEPYQTMGPLIGVFDQRSAERVNRHADALGFDGIQIGGQLAWVMECLLDGVVNAADLGIPSDVPDKPIFEPEGFDPVQSSAHNAELALALLDLTVAPGHILSRGMRAAAKHFGPEARSRAVYLSNGEEGWMVPNQYWVPGMFGPQSIMGKYYVDYNFDYHPPRDLGRRCAERMVHELSIDNGGLCRFHRGWAEKLWPEIVQSHFNLEVDYPKRHGAIAKQLHAQGKPVPWESARIEQIIHDYLKEVRRTAEDDADLGSWLERFDDDRSTAARAYWEEIRAGIDEHMATLEPGH